VRGTKTAQELFLIRELTDAVDGTCERRGEAPVHGVCIDSREAAPGMLFVALPGERTDGHEYLGAALAAGAAALMVRSDQWPRRKSRLMPLLESSGTSCISVPDTLAALQNLAAWHMRRLPGVLRIAVTGSSGKTTSKEILGAVLSRTAPTIMNKGNQNSETGVPLTAFRVDASYTYAIFEMGINHRGEMDALARIVRPDIAVITNIGNAHIGLLGSRQAIAEEKKKITSQFTGTQKLFVPEDEEFLEFLSRDVRGKVIAYGEKSIKGLLGKEDLGLDGSIINWEELRIRFPLFGKPNYMNALAAMAVAVELGVDKRAVKQGLEGVEPLFGRSEVSRGGITVIKDYYNANPDAVSGVLGFFHDLAWQGKKIVVLGSMLELGSQSVRAHEEVGRLVAGLGLDGALFLGKEAKAAYRACKKAGFRGMLCWKERTAKLAPVLANYAAKGDIVLIKGSRALELESLVTALA
jgi:UDP-N-acetylmuramoyl-tripeptide--D-alanyl-D-alanine ligase